MFQWCRRTGKLDSMTRRDRRFFLEADREGVWNDDDKAGSDWTARSPPTANTTGGCRLTDLSTVSIRRWDAHRVVDALTGPQKKSQKEKNNNTERIFRAQSMAIALESHWNSFRERIGWQSGPCERFEWKIVLNKSSQVYNCVFFVRFHSALRWFSLAPTEGMFIYQQNVKEHSKTRQHQEQIEKVFF